MNEINKTVTVDKLSDIRLYLLSVPSIFAGLLFVLKKESLYWYIDVCAIALGILLVAMRNSISFNPKTKEIKWKLGIVFPFIAYRKRRFKDVALILRTSRTQGEFKQSGNNTIYGYSTYHRAIVQLKSNNQKILMANSRNEKKINGYCERVANALSFEERPNAGAGKRQWALKKP